MNFIEVILLLLGIAYLVSIVYRAESLGCVLPIVRTDLRRVWRRLRPEPLGAGGAGGVPGPAGEIPDQMFAVGGRKRQGTDPPPMRKARGRMKARGNRAPAVADGKRKRNPNAPCWVCGQARTPGHHH